MYNPEPFCNWWTKAKLSLCLISHHVIKACWELEVHIHAFLTSAPNGSMCSDSHIYRFTQAKETGWVPSRSGRFRRMWDVWSVQIIWTPFPSCLARCLVLQRKMNFCPSWELKSLSSPQTITLLTEVSGSSPDNFQNISAMQDLRFP